MANNRIGSIIVMEDVALWRLFSKNSGGIWVISSEIVCREFRFYAI